MAAKRINVSTDHPEKSAEPHSSGEREEGRSGGIVKRLKNRHLFLVILLALSFAHRVYFFIATPSPPLPPDSKTYIRMGKNIAFHGVFSNEEPHDDPEPTAYVMPGYPLFLSPFFRVFGKGDAALQAVRFVQLMLGLLMIFCVYRIGCELGGELFGAAAGLVCAVYPPTWFVGLQILTEGTFTVAAIVFWCLFLRALRKNRRRDYIFAGLAIMAASFIRPPLVPVSLLAAAGIVVYGKASWKQRLLRVVLFLAPLFLAMTVWTIRNAVHFKHFIPLTTASNGARVKGLDTENRHPTLWPVSGLSEYEYNQMWGKWSRQLMREKLEKGYLSFFENQVVPQFKAFASYPYGTGEFQGWDSLSWREAKLIIGFHRYLLWISMVGLLLLILRDPRVWIFAGYLVYHAGVHSIWVARSRYGYPWSVVFFIFSGMVAAGLAKWNARLLKEGKKGIIASELVFFAGLVYLVHARDIIPGQSVLWWCVFAVWFLSTGYLCYRVLFPILPSRWRSLLAGCFILAVGLVNIFDNSGCFQVRDIVTDRALTWGVLVSPRDVIEHVIDLPDWIRDYDEYNLFLNVERAGEGKPGYILEVYMNSVLGVVCNPDFEIPGGQFRIKMKPSLIKESENLHLVLRIRGKVTPRSHFRVRIREDEKRGESRFNRQTKDLSHLEGIQAGTFQLFLEAIRERKGKKEVLHWNGSKREE